MKRIHTHLAALFCTLGTTLIAQGPTLVRDFFPGELVNGFLNHGQPNTFLLHNDALHLFANEGTGLPKLFRLDDLSGNVTELAQVGVPLISSTAANFVASGDNLYFMVQEGFNYTLYRVNGAGATALHTAPIQTIFGYTLLPMPGGGVIFPGYDAAAGYEPWYTDGTTGGTHLVKDIRPGTGTGLGDPYPLFNGFSFNDKAYFLAADGVTGVQLWSSDGTEAGTSEFAAINEADDSGVIQLHWSKNAQRFIVQGYEGLLTSDGTEAGTSVLHGSHYATPRIPGIAHPVTDDGVMYFTASENGTPTLFRTDGVTNTVLLNNGISVQSMPYLIEMGGMIYTFVQDDENYISLARVDPVAHTLTILTNFGGMGGSAPGLYEPYGFRSDGQHIYFTGNLAGQGTQYWMSDGTAAGTQMVHEFLPTVINGGPNAANRNMTVFQGQFVFSANDPGVGVELFAGTGSVGVSEQVPDPVQVRAWADGNGQLAILAETGEVKAVRLLDMTGKVVLERSGLHTGRAQLPCAAAPGLYALWVETTQGVGTAKLVIP